MKADLTAIILTMNEEKNLPRCLESISNVAKRIIVVDSGSTDRTVEIAKEYGAEVYANEFVNYATQFNWGIDNTNIDTRWTLRLDADEQFTEELAKEVIEQCEQHTNDDVNGMIIKINTVFLNKVMKHGAVAKFRKLMIFKTGIGRIENRNMDEHTILSEGKEIVLKGRLMHYDFKNMTFWINKHNWYSTRMMQDFFEVEDSQTTLALPEGAIRRRRSQKAMYYKAPLFVRPILLFIWRYFFQLGILDGKVGFIYNFMEVLWFRELVDVKIFEHKIMGLPIEKTGALR